MKFLTRFLLPLLLTIAAVYFVLGYKRTSPGIRNVAWPLISLTIPLVWSAFLYVLRLISPGYLQTDFRFWSWRSYLELSDEAAGYDMKYPGPRNVVLAFCLMWAFFSIGAVSFIETRYFDRHMLEHGITTRGVVVKYIRATSSRKYHRRAEADIRFITAGGESKVYRVKPLNVYTAGDSVTVRYSTVDPGFCEIDEPMHRFY
jgi:hypothetical protein